MKGLLPVVFHPSLQAWIPVLRTKVLLHTRLGDSVWSNAFEVGSGRDLVRTPGSIDTTAGDHTSKEGAMVDSLSHVYRHLTQSNRTWLEAATDVNTMNPS
ncbi:hypothetical protein BCR44DRAFT_40148 [Catenaria anguillulae PL171]|uniref:Uncharacterized protein n=1 Tax=Catenaria anguillulae PL171 TaxID=765915 RepID=A0A1Y2I0S7_9FUNG|nr:hypothetical protein BCR44DRAFT_40148 [Catenaria anguillulae PL171]